MYTMIRIQLYRFWLINLQDSNLKFYLRRRKYVQSIQPIHFHTYFNGTFILYYSESWLQVFYEIK